jgi:outer membrane usher protein
VFVALVVNGVPQGDVLAVVKPGDVLVRRADLVKAGLHDVQGRDETVGPESLVSLASLAPAFAYTFDEKEIALRVEAPPANLPVYPIDARQVPPSIDHRDDAAGYVNLTPTVTDFDRIDAYAEAAAGAHGHRLYGTATLSTQAPTARGLTTYTYEMREKLLRFSLGDTLVSTGVTGGTSYVGGVGATRTYDLDPYIVRVPSLGFTGASTAPATLQVFMNGALVKSVPIAPGTFNLTNLVGMSGAGTATYVVRDVMGHTQTYSASYYQPQAALAEGLQEFTYVAGALRSSFGIDSWGYGNAALLAKHRVGLTNWFTVGYRLEAETTLVSGGPTFVITTPIGEIGGEGAASGAKGAPAGGAGILSYSYASRSVAMSLAAQMESSGYVNVSLPAAIDRNTLAGAAAVTVPIGTRSSVTLQYGLGLDRDRPRTMNGGATWQIQLASRLNLFTSFTTNAVGSTVEEEGFLNVNVAFDGGHSASIGQTVTRAAAETLVDANKPLPAGTGYGYRVDSSLGTTNTFEADAQYQNQYMRSEVDYVASNGESHAAVTLGSALVFVPGAGVFAARTVQDGFAVVRVPGAEGVRVYANNQEVGRTNAAGDLLVPALLPYYGNRLRIEDTDVPTDFDVLGTERIVAPAYRGGALVTLPVHRAHFFRGRLIVVKDRELLVPAAYGDFVVHAGGKDAKPGSDVTTPIGKDGLVEVQDLAPGRYGIKASYDGGTCEGAIVVPDDKAAVVELGAVRCVSP